MSKPLVMLVGPTGARGGITSVTSAVTGSPVYSVEYDVAAVGTSRYRDLPAVVEPFVVLGALLRAFRLLLSGRVTLAHVHASYGVSFYRKALFVGLARAFRVPVVFHIHASRFDFYLAQSGLRRAAVRRTLFSCAAVAVLSEAARTSLVEATGAKNVRVVRNPVSVPESDMGKALRERPVAPAVVLFSGFLLAEKGVVDLLRAFAAAFPDGLQTLVFCGEGPFSSRLEQLAVDLGVQERVSLPGWQEKTEMASRYAGADIFALPSYHEGMPMAMMEAMAFGLPVIVSSVGAVPEIVTEGEEGFIVPCGSQEVLADRLRLLADDPERRRRMGERAYETARRYVPDVIAADWVALYREARG